MLIFTSVYLLNKNRRKEEGAVKSQCLKDEEQPTHSIVKDGLWAYGYLCV